MPNETNNTRWTDHYLDSLRLIQDDLADKAAESIFNFIGNDEENFNNYLKELARLDFANPLKSDTEKYKKKNAMVLLTPGGKDSLTFYLGNYKDFNFTIDERAILERASDFFTRYGGPAILILAVRSLLKQYAHNDAIQVLRLTTIIEKHPHRRIIETMQFVMDVMEPDWFVDKGGQHEINKNHPGVISIKKLRLVHAMIRTRLQRGLYPNADSESWNEEWGKPINQEDMLFAIQTFNIEVIQGLITAGYKLKESEIEDYFQAWCLIGRSLGVKLEPAMWPKNYEEGVRLQEIIYKRHFRQGNTYGPILAQGLIDWMDEVIPFTDRDTILSIIRKFNGPETYKVFLENLNIDLSKASDTNFLQKHQKFIRAKGAAGINATDGIWDDLFMEVLNKILAAERGGKGSRHFRITDGFRTAWNIDKRAEKPASPLLAAAKGCGAVFVVIWKHTIGRFFD